MNFPKIELHVHLEGTMRPETLLEIARRNDYPLPADTVEGVAKLYDFRDFAHFIEVWILTTNALRTRGDSRQVLVDYAAEATEHGAVYLEAIFSPAERVQRGVAWDDIFGGYCDGAEQAPELHGVEVRLTPDIYRGLRSTSRRSSLATQRGTAIAASSRSASAGSRPSIRRRLTRRCSSSSAPRVSRRSPTPARSRDPRRSEARSTRSAPTGSGTGSARSRIRSYWRSFASARSSSTSARSRTSAPARFAPSTSIRCPGCSRPAYCARSRRTIRRCSTPTSPVSTRAAATLGADPKTAYEAGLAGALCDDETRDQLRRIGEKFDWHSLR